MLIFRAFDSPSPSSWWLRVFRSRHLVARGGIAIAIIMVLFVSACGYQSFCDRHHYGARWFVCCSHCHRHHHGVPFVVLFWVIGLIGAFFETVGSVCSQMVLFVLRIVQEGTRTGSWLSGPKMVEFLFKFDKQGQQNRPSGPSNGVFD